MKFKKATYLSLVLLSCFLISTTFGVAFTYATSHAKAISLKNKSVSSSDNENNIPNDLNFTKIENEDETENDCELACTIQEFVIPFSFSFSGIEAAYPLNYQYSETPLKTSGPIYIATGNFRI